MKCSGPGPSLVDPVQTIAWGGTLPSPRRLVLSGLTATAVVLGGNLGGTTSRLLTLDKGEFAQKLQLDVLFPVGTDPTTSYKRCIDGRYGYEFIYPATWLADQTLAYRAARRAEMERGLDLPPVARPQGRAAFRGAPVVEPVAAYGPAGSTGEENISVIVAPIFEGFNLTSMGSPERVASQFLKTRKHTKVHTALRRRPHTANLLTQIVPLGVSVEATLLDSSARTDESDQVYYMMEYTVKSATFFRHNMSVITSRNNSLFTFNAQVPEQLWSKDADIIRSAAKSFKLTANRLDSTGFPVRL